MKLEDLLAAYRHRPFRPLLLRTERGQEYSVNHPEAMSNSEDGEIVGVMLPDHDFALLEVDAITDVVARSSRRARPRREQEP